jgi:hypothetical protein
MPAPVILFIPVFAIAAIGPCAFRYPVVIVVADALYDAMRGTALGKAAAHQLAFAWAAFQRS